MKCLLAIVSVAIVFPPVYAFADCKTELSAVKEAMRAAGPLRRETQQYVDGKHVNTTVTDFSPPDQLQVITTAKGGSLITTVIVSGDKSWSVIKQDGKEIAPPNEFKSGYLEEFSRYRLPEYQVTDCRTEGTDTLHLSWKGEYSQGTLFTDALAVASTHILKSVKARLVHRDGSEEPIEDSVFGPIAAFAAKPLIDAMLAESKPKYVKSGDVDSPVPIPSNAEKVTFDKEANSLSFASPQKVPELAEFYRTKFKAMGWTEKPANFDDKDMNSEFDSPDSQWLQIDIKASGAGAFVQVDGPYPRN
jgi:hypothetical protein